MINAPRAASPARADRFLARPGSLLACFTLLAFSAPLATTAFAQAAPGEEFVYRARLGDTLIGLSNRLLQRSYRNRWPELQARNHIADPRHIPVGTAIRIPFPWLLLTPENARVTAVVPGTATTQDGRPAFLGEMLPAGSLLTTKEDGSATVGLPDGSTVTVQKSSSLRIESLQQITGDPSSHDIHLKLESGRTETHVRHHESGRFLIQTPVALSAVRGTVFRSVYDGAEGRAADETLEGTVEVSGQVGTGVPVAAGFGTLIRRNAAPLPPVQLLPAPDLSSLAPTTGGAQLALAWPAVAGAVRYRVQIAPDPQFQTLLADMEATAPQVSAPAPPLGAYSLRVHAIDSLGLEGRDTVRTLEQRAAVPVPVAPGRGERVAGTHTDFSWSGEPSGAHYRWQLSRSGDFQKPLMEKDVTDDNAVSADGIEPGDYQWRIAAVDTRGVIGPWSVPSPYTQRPAIPVPQIEVLKKGAVLLVWEAGEASAHYRVQIARDAAFEKIVVDQVVDKAQLTIPKLHMGGYHARIQPVDHPREPFGEARQFDVLPPLWLRIAIPVAVVLAAVLG